MLNLLLFILVLSILVLVHEFGHFIVAKKAGVRVEEFGLGLPPRIFGKKIGETLYSLNVLPFGGFVKLTGEDEALDAGYVMNDNRNFMSKSSVQRILILVAGVFMNFIFALCLFYTVFFITGFKSLNLPMIFNYKFPFGTTNSIGTVVTGFQDGSYAKDAGVQVGEAILAIDDVAVYTVSDVRAQVADKTDKFVKVSLLDLKKNATDATRSVEVMPIIDPKTGKGILGAYLSSSVVISYLSPVEKLFAGPLHAFNIVGYSVDTFSKLITLSFESKSISPVSSGVAGPIGIYSVLGGILSGSGANAYLTIIDFIAIMSLSLAIINILPFPALDGGRLLFILIEVVRGKKHSPVLEASIHKWGMIVLLGFILLVTLKDIKMFL